MRSRQQSPRFAMWSVELCSRARRHVDDPRIPYKYTMMNGISTRYSITGAHIEVNDKA